MESNTVAAWAEIVNQLSAYGDDSGDTSYYELSDEIDDQIDGLPLDTVVGIELRGDQLDLIALASS